MATDQMVERVYLISLIPSHIKNNHPRFPLVAYWLIYMMTIYIYIKQKVLYLQIELYKWNKVNEMENFFCLLCSFHSYIGSQCYHIPVDVSLVQPFVIHIGQIQKFRVYACKMEHPNQHMVVVKHCLETMDSSQIQILFGWCTLHRGGCGIKQAVTL